MILLTGAQQDRLLANGRQRDQDHIPVVKFFNPLGEGVWLATELDEDGDVMFGLADIGCPELGSWSLEEQFLMQKGFPPIRKSLALPSDAGRKSIPGQMI